MEILSVLLWIYGIGAMFTVCGAIYGLSAILAERGFLVITIRNILLAMFSVFVLTVAWPWLLFKEVSFRQVVVETGRIAIIFGYLVSAMFTVIYPWIWVWYISGVVAWVLLERYHEKISPDVNLVQARE